MTYAYDLAGRMTGVSDTSAAIASVATPGSTLSYATSTTYDPLNRPTGVTFGDVPAATAPTTAMNVAFTHGYNAVNQRTSQSVSDNAWIDYPPTSASTTAYTANSLNQYTAVGAVTPSYEGNGNTTSDGTSTLGYDAENRLTSASKTGMTASYTFDARGRRKTRTVNGTTTVFVTDAANREVMEYDGSSGAILRWYAYGLGSNDVLAQMDVPGSTRLTPVPDLQGSIIATMSNAGTPTSFAYRAYGTSASAPAQFGYTGQRIDAETGSYYYRARAYSPAWGRFWQADPIGYGDGAHLYAYVGNDPLNLLDPEGWASEGFASGFKETFIGDESLDFLRAFANGSTSFRVGASAGFLTGFVARTAAESVLYLAGEAWLRGLVGGGESVVANQVPGTLARVIPEGIPATTLGRAGTTDVFVTAADDIAGMSSQEVAKRLAIPQSPSGFTVIEFPTPSTGIASPVLRSEPGFVGGGRTAGGAREFVIPNQPIPPNSTIRTVR